LKKWGDALRNEGFLIKQEYIDVFNLVNRSDFVPERFRKHSDNDEPVPIPFEQTQSAPHMDAIFINYVEPKDDEMALEIGTGSGYFSTILSFLVRRVVSIEYLPGLSQWAAGNISKYRRENLDLLVGNINRICLREKFDIIISTASFRNEPDFLSKFIKPGGRIIFPVGSLPPQRLVGFKNGKRKELGSVAFVNIAD
jgi:protein-L-isoaspartate(D-aspartate) O-methyltransferase